MLVSDSDAAQFFKENIPRVPPTDGGGDCSRDYFSRPQNFSDRRFVIHAVLEAKNNFDIGILKRYEDYIKSLRKIPCERDIDKADYFTVLNWLERLTFERLERKAGEIIRVSKILKYDFYEIFYQKVARYFGLKANSDAFELLAKSLPLKILSIHNENLMQLEALLFGQAGLLSSEYRDSYPVMLLKEYTFLASKYGLTPVDKHIWRFMRMRPANFPTVRISQFANLIYRSSGLLHRRLLSPKHTQPSQEKNRRTGRTVLLFFKP